MHQLTSNGRSSGWRRLATAAAGLSVTAGLLLAGVDGGQAHGTTGSGTFPGAGFGAIPDGDPNGCVAVGSRDVTFAVSGMSRRPLADVRLTGLSLHHPYIGDLVVTLIAPSGASQVVFGRVGLTQAPSNSQTYGSDLDGSYSFADDAPGNLWAAASANAAGTVPQGSYRASSMGGLGSTGAPVSLTFAFSGVTDPNGTWTLRFVDQCPGDVGSVTAGSLQLRAVDPNCAPQQTAVGTARTAVASAGSVVTSSHQRVVKARQQLRKARKLHDPARIRRAVRRLRKAKAAQAAARTELVAAQSRLTAAQAALSACLTS
jgi:subtilisin-like proprotein convertase family protein